MAGTTPFDPSQGSSDLASVQRNGVRALNDILTALGKIFPAISGTSSSATGGAATLPANPVGFITVTLPNGTTAKVAYYQ